MHIACTKLNVQTDHKPKFWYDQAVLYKSINVEEKD